MNSGLVSQYKETKVESLNRTPTTLGASYESSNNTPISLQPTSTPSPVQIKKRTLSNTTITNPTNRESEHDSTKIKDSSDSSTHASTNGSSDPNSTASKESITPSTHGTHNLPSTLERKKRRIAPTHKQPSIEDTVKDHLKKSNNIAFVPAESKLLLRDNLYLIHMHSHLLDYLVPQLGFSDLGGIDDVLEQVHEVIEWPMIYPQLYQHLGAKPTRGTCGSS